MSEEQVSADSSPNNESGSHTAVRHAASAGLGLTSVIATVVAISGHGLRATLLALVFAATIVGIIWVWSKNQRLVEWWSFPLIGLAIITGGGFLYEITVTEGEPPPPPRGVGARALSSTEVELYWRASSGEEGYRVYDELRGLMAELPAGTVNYIPDDLQRGTSYCFTIVAYRGNVESDRSNEACFDVKVEQDAGASETEADAPPTSTPPPNSTTAPPTEAEEAPTTQTPTSTGEPEPLAPPADLNATAMTPRRMYLEWSDKSDGEHEYHLFVERPDGTDVWPLPKDSTWSELYDLEPDTQYCYVIKAVTLDGVESEPSNQSCAKTPPAVATVYAEFDTPEDAVFASPLEGDTLSSVADVDAGVYWITPLGDVPANGFRYLDAEAWENGYFEVSASLTPGAYIGVVAANSPSNGTGAACTLMMTAEATGLLTCYRITNAGFEPHEDMNSTEIVLGEWTRIELEYFDGTVSLVVDDVYQGYFEVEDDDAKGRWGIWAAMDESDSQVSIDYIDVERY